VLAATRSDTTKAQAALEKLCRTYWYPLYAYVRRRGHPAPDAQDLTQAFFARLLERHWVGDADRERGRFRTFLLTAMSRFLSDEWDKARAQKRGGGVTHVPVQLDTAETRYGHEPADNCTPEQCYECRWALTLLDTVLQRLRAEYEHAGKGELFAGLNFCLVGGCESQPYAELATKLDMHEGAVKVAVHRLRQEIDLAVSRLQLMELRYQLRPIPGSVEKPGHSWRPEHFSASHSISGFKSVLP